MGLTRHGLVLRPHRRLFNKHDGGRCPQHEDKQRPALRRTSLASRVSPSSSSASEPLPATPTRNQKQATTPPPPPPPPPQTAIIRDGCRNPLSSRIASHRIASQQLPPSHRYPLCAPSQITTAPRVSPTLPLSPGGRRGDRGRDANARTPRGRGRARSHRPGDYGSRRPGSGSAPGDRGADRARHWARAGKRQARAVLTRSAPLPAAAAAGVVLLCLCGRCLLVCDSPPASSAPWRPATATARRPTASARASATAR